MLLTLFILTMTVLGVDLLTLPFLKKITAKVKPTGRVRRLLDKDTVSGYFLMLCAVASLLIANTHWGTGYLKLWSHSIGGHPFSHWIDDGLMAVFFLLVGLELKRELMYGELRSRKQAVLPILAAVGGMLLPAAIYIVLTWGTSVRMGFGIPMATDIAFVLAILALLGSRVPKSLKVFLTALAVIDDLGAVIVIAVFYTSNFSLIHLLLALGLVALIFIAGRSVDLGSSGKRKALIIFSLLAGVGVWILLMRSGVHASVAGVLVALAIPSQNGSSEAPAARLERGLHGPVYFFVLPLFILSNMAIPLRELWPAAGLSALLMQPHIKGIVFGLLVGKPAGILLASWAVLKMGWGAMPQGVSARQLVGASFLGGIGFTMAIFISALSFSDGALMGTAKLAVVVSSVAAAIIGSIVLRVGSAPKSPQAADA